jgi:hypothetical protein
MELTFPFGFQTYISVAGLEEGKTAKGRAHGAKRNGTVK